MLPKNSTNLKNRVSKLYLPKTKQLLPLFEVISNSIHAIQEKIEFLDDKLIGKILIKTIRNGKEETFKEISNTEDYPINSFEIIDNGIGLNNDNIESFAELDSDKKYEIGGKGIGRLVCLKAFNKMIINSIYIDDKTFYERKFEYKKTKIGFDKYKDKLETTETNTGTSITLDKYEEKYQKQVPKNMFEIARQIITHFQLYFIQSIQPEIIIKNQDDTEVNLTNIFNSEFEKKILDTNFNISGQDFKIYISKSHKAKSHKIHYCANERTVKNEGLSKYLEDLKYIIKNEDNDNGFFFQVFIVGDFLDKNVNEARTSFNFSLEEDNDDTEQTEISLSKIRKEAIKCIEELLSVFLKKVRKEKLDIYYPIIEKDFPNYHSVVNYNKERVEKLPIGLSKSELDLKLYEIESEWRLKVKSEGVELLDKKKDITNLEEYKELYDKFLSEFNEIGQSDLTRYVIHRRSVIDLLDKLIKLNETEKFANEDIIHSLFFPIRETNQTITSDKQNLWLIDERLTFNSLLASDKSFKQIGTNSESSKRMDLVIKKEAVFEEATLFAEDKFPFESFTIVEFKKPERDNYKHGEYKHDPVKQVRTYIEKIIKGNEKIKGKKINANKRTPFYCYIVADITTSLENILEYESFDPTPDGLGYFRFYETKTSRAYIEILPFKKIIKDAKQRNKILFDKLKLS